MSDRFESLDSGEVISVSEDRQVLTGHRTFRVGELNDAIKAQLASAIAGWNEEKNAWFSEGGIDCEALRFGSNGWQKGRIRLHLEFCPDEGNAAAQAASHSTPTATNTNSESTIGGAVPTPASLPLPSVNTNTLHVAEPTLGSNVVTGEGSAPATAGVTNDEAKSGGIGIPVAAAVIGTVVATAAVAGATTPTDKDPVEAPPLVDTVLELEENHYPNSLEEIAIDFSDNSNNGKVVGSVGMELDLNDLGLDLSDPDLLGFENSGLADSSEEFASFQDLDKPENSGILIDEVWNEIKDRSDNWPSIN